MAMALKRAVLEGFLGEGNLESFGLKETRQDGWLLM